MVKSIKKLRNYDTVELGFVLYIIFMPLTLSIIGIFTQFPMYEMLLSVYLMAYIIFFIFKIIKNAVDFSTFFNGSLKIVLWVLFGIMLLSSIINKSFNIHLIIYVSLLCLIVNVCCLGGDYTRFIVDSIIFVVTICALMAMVDRDCKFMPGFYLTSIPFSGQFLNPDHFGSLVSMVDILVMVLFTKERRFIKKFVYLTCFILLSFYVFFNGTMSGIVPIALVSLFYFVYTIFLQREVLLPSLFTIFIFFGIGVLVEFVPLFISFRLNVYGFYTECIAVFDNLFGTHLLSSIGIDFVPGADGYNRNFLMIKALHNLRTHFLLGNGARYAYIMRPHNEFLFFSVDFGVIAGSIYMLCPISIVARGTVKQKHNYFLLALEFAIASYLIAGVVGNILSCIVPYFLIAVCLAFKEITKKQEIY